MSQRQGSVVILNHATIFLLLVLSLLGIVVVLFISWNTFEVMQNNTQIINERIDDLQEKVAQVKVDQTNGVTTVVSGQNTVSPGGFATNETYGYLFQYPAGMKFEYEKVFDPASPTVFQINFCNEQTCFMQPDFFRIEKVGHNFNLNTDTTYVYDVQLQGNEGVTRATQVRKQKILIGPDNLPGQRVSVNDGAIQWIQLQQDDLLYSFVVSNWLESGFDKMIIDTFKLDN